MHKSYCFKKGAGTLFSFERFLFFGNPSCFVLGWIEVVLADPILKTIAANYIHGRAFDFEYDLVGNCFGYERIQSLLGLAKIAVKQLKQVFCSQPGKSGGAAQVIMMTCPRMLARLGAEAGFNRVTVNVADELREIVIVVNDQGLVSTTKQRAVAVVSLVETLRVKSVEMPHGAAQSRGRRMQQEMIVVVHKRKSVNFN